MRLGDLDALKKKIEGVVENEMPIDKKWALGLRYALKLIDNAPTVPNEYMRGYEAAEREYKRPQGEWLFTEIDENCHVYGQCSICKERNRIGKACRSCGAEMKGGAKE